jgi:sulfite reductase alpha subunit-like flavoprotein
MHSSSFFSFFYRQMERAVLHSFRKGGYTIVDPHSVGESFCTHVRREREQFQRECPGQWSWIGGLVGPTNPTWHLEMRDFLLLPQYDYCADGLSLHTYTHETDYSGDASLAATGTTASESISMMATAGRPLIVYGSETGNAEAVSRRLKRQLTLLKPILMSLDDAIGLKDIVKKKGITHVLCVCSTFGKGEAPSNAKQFFADNLPAVAADDVKFAVLALGSTLYPDFCQAGLKLDRKLFDSGLDRICTLTKADDASDADTTIMNWITTIKNMLLPPSLEAELVMYKEMSLEEEAVNVFKWHDDEELSLPSQSKEGSLCIENVDLLDSDQENSKSIRKITFSVAEESTYETGDHLSVQPVNSREKAERFLRCFKRELKEYSQALGYDGNDAVMWQARKPFEIERIEGDDHLPADLFFQMPTTLWHVAESQIDLNLGPKSVPDLLRTLKESIDSMIAQLDKKEASSFISHPKVQEFLAIVEPIISNKVRADHHDDIENFVASYPTVVDLFEHFRKLLFENFMENVLGKTGLGPIVKLPEILSVLPRLQPRFYSISSSSRANPKEVSITVGVLKTTSSRGVSIEGICSNYLAVLSPDKDRAKINIRQSTFRLPTKLSAPLMMVGAGTGLAPMMGFLEDRELDGIQGKKHLFFGCRTEADFIYEDTIRGYEKKGMINLHLALSRSKNSSKKYVQHCIEDMGEEACELLLNPDTHYYVCGDAKMAEECFEACIQVLRVHDSRSRVAAVQHLKKMRSEGRWQTDVWGIVSHYVDAKKTVAKSKKTAAKMWLTHFHQAEIDESSRFLSAELTLPVPVFSSEKGAIEEEKSKPPVKSQGANGVNGDPPSASNACCVIL